MFTTHLNRSCSPLPPASPWLESDDEDKEVTLQIRNAQPPTIEASLAGSTDNSVDRRNTVSETVVSAADVTLNVNQAGPSSAMSDIHSTSIVTVDVAPPTLVRHTPRQQLAMKGLCTYSHKLRSYFFLNYLLKLRCY
jgi:hypothetical protein